MIKFDNPDVIITDVMDSHGKWRAKKPALICRDRLVTWAAFNRRINRVANGLITRGLRRGDKVSLLTTNCIEALEILFGVIKAGGVIVPLSAMVQGQALARMVVDSDSRFLCVGPGQVDTIAPHRSLFTRIAGDGFIVLGDAVDGWEAYDSLVDGSTDQKPSVRLIYEDPFNIMYTSGTAGVPSRLNSFLPDTGLAAHHPLLGRLI